MYRECIYCKQNVTKEQAYSTRRMGGVDYYWHYLCATHNVNVIVELDIESRDKLIKYLVKAFPSPTGWVLDALKGLGYSDK